MEQTTTTEPTKRTTRRERPLRAATRTGTTAQKTTTQKKRPAAVPAPEPAVDAVEEAEQTGGPHSAAKRRTTLARIGVGVLVIALVLAIIEASIQHNRASSLANKASLQASATTAATQYGGWLSSYNYRDLTSKTAAWSEVESHSTPAYAASFNSTKSSLKSVITDYKASASGKVTAAAVQSVSSSRAVVLLFVDQTVTNSTQKSGSQTQPFRVSLTMLRQHGEWLINSVQTS